MQPFNLGYDNFLGRLAIGRIYSGKIKTGSAVFVKNQAAKLEPAKSPNFSLLKASKGKKWRKLPAGDIVMAAGLPDIYIGETICSNENQAPLPAINIDEPTISLNFLVNDSPLAGRDGKFVTTCGKSKNGWKRSWK